MLKEDIYKFLLSEKWKNWEEIKRIVCPRPGLYFSIFVSFCRAVYLLRLFIYWTYFAHIGVLC